MSGRSIYLIAYYVGKPKDRRVKTHIPGWMKKENAISYDEQVAISRTLKKRDMQCAKIILDLGQKKTVLNGWSDIRDFDKLFSYFNQNYPEQAGKTMEMIDPDYMSSRFPKNTPDERPAEPALSGSSLSST